MITITVERKDGSGPSSTGWPMWTEMLTDAPRVWEKAGINLRDFEGQDSDECAAKVKELIETILAGPDQFIGYANYYDLRATVAGLTHLFFTLREIRDGAGVVHVIR